MCLLSLCPFINLFLSFDAFQVSCQCHTARLNFKSFIVSYVWFTSSAIHKFKRAIWYALMNVHTHITLASIRMQNITNTLKISLILLSAPFLPLSSCCDIFLSGQFWPFKSIIEMEPFSVGTFLWSFLRHSSVLLHESEICSFSWSTHIPFRISQSVYFYFDRQLCYFHFWLF